MAASSSKIGALRAASVSGSFVKLMPIVVIEPTQLGLWKEIDFVNSHSDTALLSD